MFPRTQSSRDLPLCKQQIADRFVSDGEIRMQANRIVQQTFRRFKPALRDIGPGAQAQQVRILGPIFERIAASGRSAGGIAGAKFFYGGVERLTLLHKTSYRTASEMLSSAEVQHRARCISSLHERQGAIVTATLTFYASWPMRTFQDAVRTRPFALTAESFLKPETDQRSIELQAETLRAHVDGIVLTDNQYGRLHMSTVAAAGLMLMHDIDPVVQLSCRNRNRIALIADLLGAAALGARSLLLVRGNRVPNGVKPRPRAVLDTNAADLIGIARNLKTDEHLKNVPELFVGGSLTPHEPRADWVPQNLIRKADAGAQFMVSYICMDLELLRRYLKRVIAAKLTHRVSIIISTAVLSSADDARFLRDHRPNLLIPDTVIKRLASASDPYSEGISICAEQLRALADMPGVSGANIVASTDLSMIPEAIEAAGLATDGTDR